MPISSVLPLTSPNNYKLKPAQPKAPAIRFGAEGNPGSSLVSRIDNFLITPHTPSGLTQPSPGYSEDTPSQNQDYRVAAICASILGCAMIGAGIMIYKLLHNRPAALLPTHRQPQPNEHPLNVLHTNASEETLVNIPLQIYREALPARPEAAHTP